MFNIIGKENSFLTDAPWLLEYFTLGVFSLGSPTVWGGGHFFCFFSRNLSYRDQLFFHRMTLSLAEDQPLIKVTAVGAGGKTSNPPLPSARCFLHFADSREWGIAHEFYAQQWACIGYDLVKYIQKIINLGLLLKLSPDLDRPG